MKTPSTPLPYTPMPHETGTDFPAGLAMGMRQIYLFSEAGEPQYLVYREGFNTENDPKLNQIIGSGRYPQHACQSAIHMLELESVMPEDHWSRLKGCIFSKKSVPDEIALQHTVISPEGVELARADTRAEAAKLALHRVLHDCRDMTFEEYSAVSVPVLVAHGGVRSYGLLFDDVGGETAVRASILAAFKNCDEIRKYAYVEGEKGHAHLASEPAAASRRRRPSRDQLFEKASITEKRHAFESLITAVRKKLLTSKSQSVLNIHSLALNDEKWTNNIILHTSAISSVSALRMAYELHQQEIMKELEIEVNNEGTWESMADAL